MTIKLNPKIYGSALMEIEIKNRKEKILYYQNLMQNLFDKQIVSQIAII